jgi:hypothetical protein
MIPKEDIMLYPEAFDIDWFIVFKDGEVAQFFLLAEKSLNSF